MAVVGTLRKYFAAVRAEYANLTQFALNFGASIITLPITLVILLYIFRAVTGGAGTLGAYSVLKLALYYVGVAVTWQSVQSVGGAMWQSWQDINSGDLMIYLARPVDYIWLRYFRALASTSVMMGLSAVIHAGVQIAMGSFSLWHTLQYLLSVWLAFTTMFGWWFLMGALSFWWERPFTFRDVVWNVMALFSGSLIPVDLLHPVLRTVSDWLPFQGIYYLPASVFAGSLSQGAVWRGLGVQAAWAVGLLVAGRLLWGVGLRTYDGRGG